MQKECNLNAQARINGIALHSSTERLDEATLRQRAYAELLRQEAVRTGLLSAQDRADDDGVQSEAASGAIEALLERALVLPTLDQSTCSRYFEMNRMRFQHGESVHARHILFAVTPGVDVSLLRNRAEAALLQARCRDAAVPDPFGALARELSNCPSAAHGGDLGWLTTESCAPEFARELFGHAEVGVLPRLVHSRFGLHVVDVLARRAGTAETFESVQGAVEHLLRQQSYVTALRQYLQLLAANARVEGVELDTADSPLLQ